MKVITARKCDTTSPFDPSEKVKKFVVCYELNAYLDQVQAFQHSDKARGMLAELNADTTTLYDRLVLGRQLAVRGDPRLAHGAIGPVCAVPFAEARIGISRTEVADVVEEFGAYGVLEEWILKEVPRHSVKVGPIEFAKYPVTNYDYLGFLLEHPDEEVPSSWEFASFPFHRANHPVYSLSETAAEAYCRWLAGRTGRPVRLPTEAEWEFAAGASTFKYPWGDRFEKTFTNTAELGVMNTTPIGTFPEGNSPFGISDMGGNVEEYCANNYYAYNGGEFVKDDLISNTRPNYRITRGGCFGRFGDLARVSRRHGLSITPFASLYAAGFRVVVDMQAPTAEAPTA